MNKLQELIFHDTVKYAVENKIHVNNSTDALVQFAVTTTIERLSGLEHVIEEIADDCFNEDILVHLDSHTDENDHLMIQAIKTAIYKGIAEHKKIF